MPSPVGHALAGVAVALAGRRRPAPLTLRRFVTDPLTLWSVALATLPDADLLMPGFHRTVTHSVSTTLAVSILAIVVTGKVTGKRLEARGWGGGRIAWGVVLTLAAAHASHMLLDWLGADLSQPAGIQALWPWSDRWFISGWDLFPWIERRRPFSAVSMIINLHAFVWEALLMGSIVGVIWWLRQGQRRSTQSTQRPQSSH